MTPMRRFAALLLVLVSACATPSPPGADLGVCESDRFLKEGDALPTCRFETLPGDSVVALDDLRGTPTVLNFWASWCVACRKEMPAFDAYASAHPEVRLLGVDVIGVQGETLVAGRKYFAERGVRYESLADREGQFYGLFGTPVRPIMPLTVVLDDEGIVRARRFGELTQGELETLVKDALAA